jgi:hypothetical protein
LDPFIIALQERKKRAYPVSRRKFIQSTTLAAKAFAFASPGFAAEAQFLVVRTPESRACH